ncbi:MAG: hypothetical protein ACR2PO_00440 [Methyloligellaceae bacterium]
MAKSEDHMAAAPEAVRESEVQDSALPPNAQIAALESKRVFLDRTIAWHETSKAASPVCGCAQQGANLLALEVKQQLSSEALSLAMAEERNILLRF